MFFHVEKSFAQKIEKIINIQFEVFYQQLNLKLWKAEVLKYQVILHNF